MIAKFESICGENLAALLTFIHGDGNRVAVPRETGERMIVRVKAFAPRNSEGNTAYDLTLGIVEWLPKGDEPGRNRVDPKYLLKVYEVLGIDRPAQSASADALHSSEEKWPPIALGTAVRTTEANEALRIEWADGVWEARKWGVDGTVLAYHDSHGLFYEVRHADGSQGCYDPTELMVVAAS